MATQRSESYHPLIKKVINGQLSLKDSGKIISEKILSIITKLLIDEDREFININFTLNIIAFKFLIGAISIKAIRLIKKE